METHCVFLLLLVFLELVGVQAYHSLPFGGILSVLESPE